MANYTEWTPKDVETAKNNCRLRNVILTMDISKDIRIKLFNCSLFVSLNSSSNYDD